MHPLQSTARADRICGLFYGALVVAAAALFDLLIAGVAFCASASEFQGTYILKEDPTRRVELAAEGACFATLDGGRTLFQGTWTVDGATCSCSAEGREQRLSIRWRVDGADLVDQKGRRWVRRESLEKFPWTTLSPVAFQVVDRATGAPISRFAYEFVIADARAEFRPLLVRPIEVDSPDGTFPLQAPSSFEIELCVISPDIPRGYGSWKSFQVRSTDKERRVRVEVGVGVTVEGVVLDEVTGLPVADAEVSPRIFAPPLELPDHERSVKTDERGRFVLRGVSSCGFEVSHPKYKTAFLGARRSQTDLTVLLSRGHTVTGTVRDPAGQPIAGVWVQEFCGKWASTGADGRFSIEGLPFAEFRLELSKPGWIEQHLDLGSSSDVEIILEPCPVLRGTVLDESDYPVRSYTVYAGAGVEPYAWRCSEQRISDDLGRFEQWIPIRAFVSEEDRGKAWVAVVASGYAPYFAGLDLWTGAKTVEFRLGRGASVRGRVEAPPGARQGIRAQVVPAPLDENRSDLTFRQQLATVSAPVSDAGEFCLLHLQPGQYVLTIFGPGITPLDREVTVPEEGLDVGTLRPVGTGAITGRAWMRGKGVPWTFGKGEIRMAAKSGSVEEDKLPGRGAIPFRTDEDGWFHVQSVPVGEVLVGIEERWSADFTYIDLVSAVVREGETTEVFLHAPRASAKPESKHGPGLENHR